MEEKLGEHLGERGLEVEKIVCDSTSGLSRTDEVYRSLRSWIISGRLRPFERLVEDSLAQQLGVSRNPVREAIRMLAVQNLVAIQSNKGAVVRNVEPEEIEETFLIVGVLEAMAAALACSRLTTEDIAKMESAASEMSKPMIMDDYKTWLKKNLEFHGVFINGSGKTLLAKTILEKRVFLNHYWHLACTRVGMLDTCNAYHQQILSAFCERDEKLVRKVVEEHDQRTGLIIKEFLLKYFPRPE
jgi:DNA-binding GntR family transcriptional regulator